MEDIGYEIGSTLGWIVGTAVFSPYFWIAVGVYVVIKCAPPFIQGMKEGMKSNKEIK